MRQTRLLERRAARQNEIAQSRILALPSAYRNGNVEAWEHALRAFGIARPSKNLGSAGHERSDLTSLDALHQIEQRSSFHARKRGPSVSTRHETPVSRAILVFGAASGVVARSGVPRSLGHDERATRYVVRAKKSVERANDARRLSRIAETQRARTRRIDRACRSSRAQPSQKRLHIRFGRTRFTSRPSRRARRKRLLPRIEPLYAC